MSNLTLVRFRQKIITSRITPCIAAAVIQFLPLARQATLAFAFPQLRPAIIMMWGSVVGVATYFCSEYDALAAASIEILAPGNNLTVATSSSPTFTIYGEASSDTTISKVEYQIDNGPWLPGTISVTKHSVNTFSTNFTISSPTFTITTRVTDSGNSVATDTKTYHYGSVLSDLTRPTLNIVSPSIGAHVQGVFNMTGNASDNIGVGSVIYRTYTNAWFTASGTTAWSASVRVKNSGGNVVMFARSVDTSGNKSVLRNTLYIPNSDNTIPTVGITTPTGGANVANSINCTGVAADNVYLWGVQVRTNSGPWTAATYSSGNWNYTFSGIPSGNIKIDARSEDAWGNFSSISTVNVTGVGDATPPTVAITSPAGGSSVSGAFSLSGTAADNVGLAKVQWRVGTGIWSDATGTASWSANVPAQPNGGFNVSAHSIDNAGNTSVVSTVSLTAAADSTAPTVNITSPTGGSTITGGFTASGTAADNIAVAKVQWRIGTGTWSDATGTTSWSGNVPVQPGGSVSLSAHSIDTSGNTSTVSTVSFTSFVDSINPTAAITSHTNSEQVVGNFTLSGTAADETALSSVEIRVNNGPWYTATGTASWSASVTNNLSGNLVIDVRSKDTSSNYSTITTITLKSVLDIIPPTVAITAPTDGMLIGYLPAIFGVATDNNGVDSVDIQVGTANWVNVPVYGTNWYYDVPSVLPFGPVSVSVRSIDSSSNISSVVTANYTVIKCKKKPRLKVLTPKAHSTQNANALLVTGTSSSPKNIAINRILCRVGAANPYVAAFGSANWSLLMSNLPTGPITLDVVAVDSANHPRYKHIHLKLQ